MHLPNPPHSPPRLLQASFAWRRALCQSLVVLYYPETRRINEDQQKTPTVKMQWNSFVFVLRGGHGAVGVFQFCRCVASPRGCKTIGFHCTGTDSTVGVFQFRARTGLQPRSKSIGFYCTGMDLTVGVFCVAHVWTCSCDATPLVFDARGRIRQWGISALNMYGFAVVMPTYLFLYCVGRDSTVEFVFRQ